MILAIYCAGGLGKEVLALACSINRWEAIVFVDDVTDCRMYHGASVHRFEELLGLVNKENIEFVIASGEPTGRKALYKKLKDHGCKMTNLISPYASLGVGTQLGEGCILWDCVITNDAIIGENVLINTRALLGHDVIVGSHGVISANCFLGGHTVLDEYVYMAPGAMMKDRIHVGEQAIISLGAVVLRNVRSKAIMIGNPARKIGENTEGRVFGRIDG